MDWRLGNPFPHRPDIQVRTEEQAEARSGPCDGEPCRMRQLLGNRLGPVQTLDNEQGKVAAQAGPALRLFLLQVPVVGNEPLRAGSVLTWYCVRN